LVTELLLVRREEPFMLEKSAVKEVEGGKGEVVEGKGELVEGKGEVVEGKGELEEGKGEMLEEEGKGLVGGKGEVLESKGEVAEDWKGEVLVGKGLVEVKGSGVKDVLAWAEGKGEVEVVGKEGWEAEGGIRDKEGALGVRREAEEEEGGRWKGVLLSRVGEKGDPGAWMGGDGSPRAHPRGLGA